MTNIIYFQSEYVENFGHIYISSKEFIQHLLDENKFLKEQLEILTKILNNNTN